MPTLRCVFHFMATVLLAAVFFAASAMAQPGSGTLRGTMTDNSGAVIPAAKVTLTGRGVNRTAQTQADGTYVFPGVAPGQYTVKAVLPGFSTVSVPVNINAGANLVLPIKMLVSAEEQEITVADENTTLKRQHRRPHGQARQLLLRFHPPADNR